MKIFSLDRKAYHLLEKIHHVSISESGHSVQPHDSRVRYYIFLDEKRSHWVYQKYIHKRNSVGDVTKDKKISLCVIHANFDQITKYNY